jgi:parvulin-like peptidyl-prolyl isomerase
VKITDRNADNSQVRLSGILLPSMEEALSVKARIDAGEDFTALAQQYSQNWSDTAKDDLGWIKSDSTAVYQAFAFSADNAVGSVSPVVKDTSATTKGGYWLFKPLSTVTQDLSSDDKTSLSNKAFNAWLAALQADTSNKITNSLDDAKKKFASAQAGG